MTQEALNIAGQCRATASSELAKNILVDEGNGLLTELLLDAARIIEALAQPEQETPKGWKSEIWKSVKQQEQEPVTWGVDWGKAGDIPCVSIIKRVPNGGIEVMAVEYAPYSYTTPPKQEPVRIMGFNCKCGRRMEVSAEQGVVPAPQRTWVGLTDEEKNEFATSLLLRDRSTVQVFEAIEAKLKEKNT